MNEPGIIKGSFADYRTVKSRKVLQLIIEVPAEEATEAFKRLGIPTGAHDIWVAVARLDLNERPIREPQATLPSTDEPQAKRKWSDLSPSQQAGIRCNEPAFWKWIADAANADEAAECVRSRCNVASRSELNTNLDAEARWFRIDAEYSAWLRGDAA